MCKKKVEMEQTPQNPRPPHLITYNSGKAMPKLPSPFVTIEGSK
jgi:hypothetical protein